MTREEEDLSRVMSNYEQDWRKGWVANSRMPHDSIKHRITSYRTTHIYLYDNILV